jgi:hypothetical protein
MAYTKGMLRVHDCEHADERPCCDGWEKSGGREAGDPLCDLHGISVEHSEAFLPHSCDEWIIGDEAAVRTLIADLELALLRMGTAPEKV